MNLCDAISFGYAVKPAPFRDCALQSYPAWHAVRRKAHAAG